MGVSYKDRLEGGFQFVRIRRFKAWTAAGLILATSGLVAVSLAEGGASARPLYFPVEAFLPALLVMFLIGLILEMFFRTLSIKYAKKDGQRYLMVQGSISRAKLTIAICIVIAVILLAPATRGAADGSASPPTTRYSLGGNAQWTFRFDNQDGLGISRYNTFLATLTSSGGKLRVEVLRGTTPVGNTVVLSVMGTSVNVVVDLSGLFSYAITFTNLNSGQVTFSYLLDGHVFPGLFAFVPGVAIALAIACLAFIIYLRPRREKFKQAAIYSGEFKSRVDSGERLYSEYTRISPDFARAVPAGNPAPASPAPAVSPYVPPYVPPPPSGNPGTHAPDLPVAPRVIPPSPAPPPIVAAPRMPTPSELFAEGASLFSEGEYELAVQKFNEVRRLDPRHTRALLGKGEALLRLGRANAALETYDEILRHDRGNLDALLGTAAAYGADHRWRDVIDLADTFLAIRPGDPEMLVHRGDAQLALGKRAEAQISWEAALMKRPGDPSIQSRIAAAKVDIAGIQSRALIASASGNLDQAIALFDEVLKVEPENSNALVGKSVALRRAGRADDAIAALNAVLARQPGHGGALLNKGRILEERGDLDDALEAYDKLIELNPGDSDAWVAQGDVLAKMGRDGDARRSYNEGLKISPGDEDIRGKMTGLEQAVAEESSLLRELFLIKGIGPAKAKALRDAGFRTAEDFRKASEDDLMQIRGVTRKVAADVIRHFQTRSGDASG